MLLTSRGCSALPPSPLVEGGAGWDDSMSVDLDEATRLAVQMVDDGASGIGLCGTTGECATLLWSEKVAMYGAVIDAVAGRVPVWCGTTALGTREVVLQMRAAKDLGAAAAFVGLPLWQTPTMDNAVGFFADLGEAVPDLPIMVYANSFFFKFDFSVRFWEGIAAKAPTVIATKVGFPLTREHLDAARKQVNFMTGEGTIGNHYRLAPETVDRGVGDVGGHGPRTVGRAARRDQRGQDRRGRAGARRHRGRPAAGPGLRGLRQVQPSAREGPDQRRRLHALRPTPARRIPTSLTTGATRRR